MKVRATRGFLICIVVFCFVVFGEFDEHAFKYFRVEVGDGVNIVVCFIMLLSSSSES